MRLNDKYFPYPVINDNFDDFLTTNYEVDVESFINDEEIKLNINFKLSSAEHINLIKSGQASFVVHLEESRTMFRKVYHFSELENVVKISSDKVRYKLELTSFIVAKNKIENFKTEDLDIIYNNININYDRYNIIGLAQTLDVNMTKENDEIKNIKSIFSVIADLEEEKFFDVELTNESIIIKMPKEDFQLYTSLGSMFSFNKNNKNNLILMTVVLLPPFVEVLNRLKTDTDSYRNCLWYNSLLLAFKKKEIDLEKEFKSERFDAYRLSQIIFDEVISKSIKGMRSDEYV